IIVELKRTRINAAHTIEAIKRIRIFFIAVSFGISHKVQKLLLKHVSFFQYYRYENHLYVREMPSIKTFL
ncbi:MAG TPA: hypothetical protein VM935_19985, partial [Chitinophagaceae bacterium]|nr:hypothetical protein [Chitinophagaceae bacterium]